MAKPFITIIGVGVTGSSIGRALRKEQGDYEVVGHDKSAAGDNDAKRTGAVDRAEWNLHRAVEGASIVVLAIPIPEVAETLRLIGEDIAENTLVLVFASLIQPVFDAAEQYLPKHRRVVGAHIVLRVGTADTDSEPLAGATVCIVVSPDTEPAAVELASDFVERIGATPHFMDAEEHDGIISLVEQAPVLLGVTVLKAALQSAGWEESRRVAGPRFARATDMGGNAHNLATSLLLNRESVLLRVGQLQRELERLRALIESDAVEGQPHPLDVALTSLFDDRATWVAQAETQKWDDSGDQAGAPNNSGMMRQLFLGNLGRRKSPPASK
jgi:prephenate dehydrogenase